MPPVSQFAGALPCPHCGQKHCVPTGPAHPDLGQQQQPVRLFVTIHCPDCGRDWYAVWDEAPPPAYQTAEDQPIPDHPVQPAAAPEPPPSEPKPAPVWLFCPHCAVGFQVDSAAPGLQGTCRACGGSYVVLDGVARKPDEGETKDQALASSNTPEVLAR